MPKSTALRNSVLDLLGGTTITAPANVSLSLHTADPGLTGANELPTAPGTGYTDYARLSVTNNATNFPAASAGSKTWPGVALTFDSTAVVSGTAPTVTHLGIWNGSTFWRGIALSSSQVINNGNGITIAQNAFTSTET